MSSSRRQFQFHASRQIQRFLTSDHETMREIQERSSIFPQMMTMMHGIVFSKLSFLSELSCHQSRIHRSIVSSTYLHFLRLTLRCVSSVSSPIHHIFRSPPAATAVRVVGGGTDPVGAAPLRRLRRGLRRLLPGQRPLLRLGRQVLLPLLLLPEEVSTTRSMRRANSRR